MRAALVIAGRDLRGALGSPATHGVLAGFLALAGLFFLLNVHAFSNLSELARERARRNPGILGALTVDDLVLQPLCVIVVLLLLVVVPLLTMRTFAEERRSGTFELLMTAPVSPAGLVIGKFLASWSLALLAIALTTTFPALLLLLRPPSGGRLLALGLGLALVAAVFAATGVLCSAATRSPALAAFSSFAVLVASAAAGVVAESSAGPTAALFERISVTRRVEPFLVGVLDTGVIAWFLLVTVGLLVLAERLVDLRRWA